MGGGVGVVRRKESDVERIVLQLLVSGECKGSIKARIQVEELYIFANYAYTGYGRDGHDR